MLAVFNDLHIGVNRSAGTTPVSQFALRKYAIDQLRELLTKANGKDVMILGDLFDTHTIAFADIWETYATLCIWLRMNPGRKLWNVAGNHDLSRTSSVLSSFQFLGKLLTGTFDSQYIHVEAPTLTPYGYIIPHLRNQDLFDLALSNVPECAVLFVHANIDNNFAAQSDQSLNISAAQVAALPVQKIVCAHEHHRRDFGKVVIPGNQFGTSVSDWLPDTDKFYTLVSGTGDVTVELSQRRVDNFEVQTWPDLKFTDRNFVRVEGTVPPMDVSSVITGLNKLRGMVSSFVVTNAVKTADDKGEAAAVFSANLEAVAKFDIVAAVKKMLSAEEFAAVEKYLC